MFQSTRPVRGATPYGKRIWQSVKVSIHAPRAGRDDAKKRKAKEMKCFNPRAPCGARLEDGNLCVSFYMVSIHAPRAGRDCARGNGLACFNGFNPRAPCGARRQGVEPGVVDPLFQSTRPVRGATPVESTVAEGDRVSIHAPRAGRDVEELLVTTPVKKFQSTRPVRGATTAEQGIGGGGAVSIHAPRAGRDRTL